MKYHRMKYKMDWANGEGGEAMILLRRSHNFVETKTGSFLMDYSNNDEGERVTGPFICDLDDEDQTNRFPTFFTSPALIATKQFYQDLTEAGVNNLEVLPVIIRDKVNNREINDYVLINIIGRMSCAAMEESDSDRLNEEADENDFADSMYVINKLVIDSSKTSGMDFFVLHEDTDNIIVSEQIVKKLEPKNYKDVEFEELETI
jgi:hypothetical protein